MSKAGNWLKKKAVDAGAIGLGLAGSMEKGEAASYVDVKKGAVQSDTKKIESTSARARIESTDSFDVIDRDAVHTWGVEYVPKTDKDGSTFIAERYVRIDNKNGAIFVLGEYDTVLEAAEKHSKLSNILLKLSANARLAASNITTEREFQKSGLGEDTGVVKE